MGNGICLRFLRRIRHNRDIFTGTIQATCSCNAFYVSNGSFPDLSLCCRRLMFRPHHWFWVALYQFITLKTALYKKSKSIKELEEKIAILEHTSSSAPLAAVSGPPGLSSDYE